MKRLMVMLAGAGLMSAAPASLYTNTWKAAEGLTSQKNWNDADNWTVQYEGELPAPASAVPTADSWTRIQRSASITLQPGDDLHSGKTWLLAGGGVANKDLNLTIPAGAKLSLDGVDDWTSFGAQLYAFGEKPWTSGGIDNHVNVDLAGDLVFGQKIFGMRGPFDNAVGTLSRVVNIGDGGTFAVTNGVVWFSGGELGGSTGKGSYSNVIEIARGGTMRVTGPSYVSFGGNYDAPSVATACPNYCGGGWINVRGGSLDFTGCTYERALQMATHADATVGGNLVVTDGGVVNLGGKSINICSTGKKTLVRVANGGVLSNATVNVARGGGNVATYENRFEIDGGDVNINCLAFAKDTASNGGRMTILVRGWQSKFRVARPGSYIGWYYQGGNGCTVEQPYFMDFRLTAHTPRTVPFPVAPYATTKPYYDPGNGGDCRSVHGFNRLSPEGGLQLVHEKKFTLVAHTQDTGGDVSTHLTFPKSYGGLIGDEMWKTNTACVKENRWIEYGLAHGEGYAYTFGVTLKDEAKLVDGGEELETGVPRAWLELPKFTARDLNAEKTKSVSVRVALEPQGDATLESLVADMKAAGQDGAAVDNSVAPYNVRIDLPMDELAVDAANDSVVMDFVKVDTYAQAKGLVPFQTNALIRAASCEVVRFNRGTNILIR